MGHRRTEGLNWPLLAGIAAAAAMVVAAVLAPWRQHRLAGHGPAQHGQVVYRSRPVRRSRAARVARMAQAREEREAKAAHSRFSINWPLALGIAAALFLLWLWWWSATRGGPG
ncbi:hypothetical protein [Actinomadura rupiterrae]|uniref:hypothetical protein n=1 Tax=Actinomadura rupiterrae TaxID=559627 RepID=UPI0020A35753|nr:hypothetical protein [Actinomadura rupiterrae]MCP2343424.1 multidrug efflux pump subunit AcrB [Actinomadura rupiterrae]